MTDTPERQIRAVYDAHTIRVYQAYSDEIADAALARGTFISPPFKMDRMTWIKPSFLWMMYRAGWGYKDAGQRRILAIDISREGFQWALAHSCPSHPEPSMSKEAWDRLKAASPVRIQWDPERDLHLQPLAHRAIQIGVSGEAVSLYVNQWIRKITDVTDVAHAICDLVKRNKLDQARARLPAERPTIRLFVEFEALIFLPARRMGRAKRNPSITFRPTKTMGFAALYLSCNSPERRRQSNSRR